MDPSTPRIAMQPIRPLPPMLPAQTAGYQSPTSQVESPSPAPPPPPQQPQQPSSSPNKSRPTKRQKVSLACQECRDRKIKCDGARPTCGPCVKKKKPEGTCVYEPERARRGVKSQYVQLLENKVRELENAMRQDKGGSFSVEKNPSLSINNLTSPSNPPTPLPPTTPTQHEQQTSSSIPPDSNSHHQDILLDGSITLHPATSLPNDLNPTIRNSAPESNVRGSYTTNEQWHSPSVTAPSPPPPQSQSLLRDTPEVDAMGAFTGSFERSDNNDGDGNRQGYFGSSSAMSFMRQVREVIDKKTTSSSDDHHEQQRRHSRQYSLSSKSSRNTSSADGAGNHAPARSYSICHDYVLPPRKVADSLIKSYWTYVHTLYPFLHKPSFMRTYSRLWECSEDDISDRDTGFEYESESDPLFQCILNLVFALGCQLSPEIGETERESSADVFFQRSKKLLHFDILDEGNMKVVQALLLMGQYLQCTKMPARCWIVVGLATRVAQGLGLHRDLHECDRGTSRRHSQQLESQMRKRLWGGCIVLDRVISMAYGRPFMIPVTQDLNLPQVIDDELLTSYPDTPAEQPHDKPSHMSFFVHTLQLYEIMGEILTTLYSNSTKRSSGEGSASDRAANLNGVIKFEMALQSWERALPWFLRLRTYTKDAIYGPLNPDSIHDRILIRQNNVLRARYLHTCILLYRPVFAYFFASEESNHSGDDSGLQKSLFLQSSTTCVNAAQELVDVIHRNIRELLPAWWYNMFYLYTSATVLLMARLFPTIKQAIGEDHLIKSWSRCLECLSQYQSYSGSAQCCYQSLSELDKMAFQSPDDDQANKGMSSIQILGTLPGNIATASESNDTIRRENELPIDQSDPATVTQDQTNGWDFGLQDMSWLGRLPVYTDLEPGLQFNQWMGRFCTDVNNLF